MSVARALGATTGDGWAATVAPMQEPMVFNHARTRALLESPGCYELDADMTRMTPMAAAARCSGSLLVAATEIETLECVPRPRHAQPARRSQAPRSVAKRLNPPRFTNDPKSFVLCPYNATHHQRRSSIRERRLVHAMLGGPRPFHKANTCRLIPGALVEPVSINPMIAAIHDH